MAKVTFGAGAEVSVAPVKKEESILAQRHPVIDVQAMVEKAISELPKYDATFGSALGQLRDEMKHEVNEVRKEQSALRANLESLGGDMEVEMMAIARHIEDMAEAAAVVQAPAPQIIHPEVKSITHIKDVSKEVMEHVEANKRQNSADYMCHANHIVAIESALKGQKIMNCILIGALLITILSRLF